METPSSYDSAISRNSRRLCCLHRMVMNIRPVRDGHGWCPYWISPFRSSLHPTQLPNTGPQAGKLSSIAFYYLKHLLSGFTACILSFIPLPTSHATLTTLTTYLTPPSSRPITAMQIVVTHPGVPFNFHCLPQRSSHRPLTDCSIYIIIHITTLPFSNYSNT